MRESAPRTAATGTADARARARAPVETRRRNTHCLLPFTTTSISPSSPVLDVFTRSRAITVLEEAPRVTVRAGRDPRLGRADAEEYIYIYIFDSEK